MSTADLKTRMATFSQAEYLAALARMSKQPAGDGSGVEEENPLQAAIAKDCLHRGWICFRGSMRHRTHRTVGEFDLIILRDNGRILLVECKTEEGKLSPAQLAIHAWAAKLGHVAYVVRSFEQFIEICKT